MIYFADEIHAWGHTATVHYTHPPRSVLMQFVLAARSDFTEHPPSDPIFRAAAFFRSYISNGVETDLSVAPLFSPSQFIATDVTEVKGEFIAQNCGARALATQFPMAPAPTGGFDMQADMRVLAYHNSVTGTVRYKHIVKAFTGGRTVSEQEAIRDAENNARRIQLDLSGLTLKAATSHGPSSATPTV